MSAVTANQVIIARNPGNLCEGLAKASTNLYQGTICYYDASNGYIVADDNTGANTVAGVVKIQCDNSSGTDGAANVEFYTTGFFTLTQSGLAQANVGDAAHAIDNITVSNTGGSILGRFTKIVSSTQAEVQLIPKTT